MRSVSGRLSAPNKFLVFGAHFQQEANEKAEETKVRVQDTHVGLRFAVSAASTRRGAAACQTGSPDIAVPDQRLDYLVRTERGKNDCGKKKWVVSARGAGKIKIGGRLNQLD